MLLTILTLGSTILGATTIAGFLMLYQIRQSTDLANSGKAIFAADAGVEWATYSYVTSLRAGTPVPLTPQPTFSNGATVSAVCRNSCSPSRVVDCSKIAVPPEDPCESAHEVRSVGTAYSASRAFRSAFE